MRYKVWVSTNKDLPEGENFERYDSKTKKVEYLFDYLYSEDFEVEKIEKTEGIPKSWQLILKAEEKIQKEDGKIVPQRKFYNLYIETVEDKTNEELEWEISEWLREEGHEGVLISVRKMREPTERRISKCRKCGGRLKPIKHKYPNALQCQKCGEVYIELSLDPSKFSPRIKEGLKKAKKAGEKLPFGLDEVIEE